jgi:Cu(I)/Ag(I) efflux system membrane fusion protein
MTTTDMKRIKWIAAALALLALGIAGGFWWARSSMSASRSAAALQSPAGSATAAGAGPTKRRILYWQDPMVPGQKFDKPGTSPYMNMPLVPVYADAGGDTGELRISANMAQSLGIRLGNVERAAWPTRLEAVGSVAFDERALELVQARVEGYVTKLYVNTPLERVRRGQPLAVILAPQWVEAEQEYLALLDAQSERGRSLRDAARQRLAVLGVPEEIIRRVETDRKTDASMTIAAPIDGVVAELGVRAGAAFMPGTVLFRINGLASVWVNAQVPEAKVSLSPVGAVAHAHAIAWPGVTFEGRVIALLPQIDPQTRTLTARVALANPGEKLAPGMYVSLVIDGPAGPPQLVVPSEAVIVTGERSVVIAAGGGGTFQVVNVVIGAEQGGKTEIVSGLSEGQSIVLSGQFLIDSEANLKATTNRFGTAPTADAGVPERAP